MRLVACTRCASKELLEEDGVIVCTYCQSRFAQELDDLPRKKTVIGVHSDVQVLLQKCKDDPINRGRYVNLILDIDPTNQEVSQYLR